jgi:F420H(2)-dependent quinone reductase
MSIIRIFLALHVFAYRLTGGKVGGQIRGLPVLLLTTTGAKSGRARTVPLGYIESDGCPVIIASNSGNDRNPGWFYNLQRHPQARIQIGDKVSTVTAQVAAARERDRLWARLVKLSPGYANYAARTDRTIPMLLLTPAQV